MSNTGKDNGNSDIEDSNNKANVILTISCHVLDVFESDLINVDCYFRIQETRDISAAILFMMFLLVVNEYLLHRLTLLKERFPKLSLLQATSITTLLGKHSNIYSPKLESHFQCYI